MVTAVQKHYYGYGSVIDVGESFRDSCVLGSKEIGRVFAGCDFRSVIRELRYRTDRVQTCDQESRPKTRIDRTYTCVLIRLIINGCIRS
jgi:hypothetical protein